MPDEPKKVDQPAPTAKPPTTEELLAQNSTPEGRARTAAMFGVVNTEQTGDTIIDVFEPGDQEGPAARDEMVAHFGGPEGLAVASADLNEAIELLDPEREMERAVAGMTRADENAAIKQVVAEWRGVLANPEKAQALLAEIYAHPMQEPGKSYFSGKGSPALNDAIAKLWQVIAGEAPVGRPKPRGDGYSY